MMRSFGLVLLGGLCSVLSTAGAAAKTPARRNAPAVTNRPARAHASRSETPSSLPILRSFSEEEGSAAVKSINTFGSRLYSELRATPANLALSPAAAAIALGLVSGGAAGETLTEMRAALAHTLAPGVQHSALAVLSRRWKSMDADGLQVSMASRLFGDTAIPFAPAYLDWCARAYQAPVERLSFARPREATSRVNALIKAITNGQIRELVTPDAFVSPAGIVIATALHFRARWRDQFDRDDTRRVPFWIRGAESIAVPTMTRTATYAYGERQNGAVLELPYEDESFSMYVLLPHDRDGLSRLEEECLRPALDVCLGALADTRVDLRLPRFRIETEVLSLRGALQRFGMSRAFDATRADFSSMALGTTKGPFLGDLFQRSFLVVDEEGTEAGAVTVAAIGRGGPPPRPVPFYVDRPFAFVLVDKTNSAVMFVGRVIDPRG